MERTVWGLSTFLNKELESTVFSASVSVEGDEADGCFSTHFSASFPKNLRCIRSIESIRCPQSTTRSVLHTRPGFTVPIKAKFLSIQQAWQAREPDRAAEADDITSIIALPPVHRAKFGGSLTAVVNAFDIARLMPYVTSFIFGISILVSIGINRWGMPTSVCLAVNILGMTMTGAMGYGSAGVGSLLMTNMKTAPAEGVLDEPRLELQVSSEPEKDVLTEENVDLIDADDTAGFNSNPDVRLSARRSIRVLELLGNPRIARAPHSERHDLLHAIVNSLWLS